MAGGEGKGAAVTILEGGAAETSVFAPLIAGITGNISTGIYPSFLYIHAGSLYDVTSGNNRAAARRICAPVWQVMTTTQPAGLADRHRGVLGSQGCPQFFHSHCDVEEFQKRA
jgi:hypothetical protein